MCVDLRLRSLRSSISTGSLIEGRTYGAFSLQIWQVHLTSWQREYTYNNYMFHLRVNPVCIKVAANSKYVWAKVTWRVFHVLLSVYQRVNSPMFWFPCSWYLTWRKVIGASFLTFSLSMVSLSFLRSNFVPTRMIGTWGQWCRTSWHHLARTFSKLAGLTREKQMNPDI